MCSTAVLPYLHAVRAGRVQPMRAGPVRAGRLCPGGMQRGGRRNVGRDADGAAFAIAGR